MQLRIQLQPHKTSTPPVWGCAHIVIIIHQAPLPKQCPWVDALKGVTADLSLVPWELAQWGD